MPPLRLLAEGLRGECRCDYALQRNAAHVYMENQTGKDRGQECFDLFSINRPAFSMKINYSLALRSALFNATIFLSRLLNQSERRLNCTAACYACFRAYFILSNALCDNEETSLLRDGVEHEKRIYAKEKDSGAVHVLGNGRICAYETGPEIIQGFGYPDSATTCFTLFANAASCVPERCSGTNIWMHRLSDGTEFCDVADTETFCFVRRITTATGSRAQSTSRR